MLELARADAPGDLWPGWEQRGALTVKQAAGYLKFSERTIYRMCDRGELLHSRGEGGRIRFRLEDLESWLDEHQVDRLPATPSRPRRQSGVGRGSSSKRVSSSDGLSARELGDRLRRGEGWE